MEKSNPGSRSSSSSLAVDLFGPKGSSKSSSLSTGLFGSIFEFDPPSSVVPGRDASRPAFSSKHESTDYSYTVKRDLMKNGDYDKDKVVPPCYYNSSIYYGGQEVYSSTNSNLTPPNSFKKDGGGVDQNDSNSSCASRGNWWQGSLYY